MTQCNFKFWHTCESSFVLWREKSWWSLENNPEEIPIKWMTLKFWSQEFKFWTSSVLQRCGFDWWSPSPKPISGFQNQNLCDSPNRTSFARMSWFLVKVHFNANSCRITPFEQFWILKWRNRPQIWNVHEKLSKASVAWKFCLRFYVFRKSAFYGFL